MRTISGSAEITAQIQNAHHESAGVFPPHACLHCQKVTVNLDLIRPWYDPRPTKSENFGVSYAEAVEAAREGCSLFQKLLLRDGLSNIWNTKLTYREQDLIIGQDVESPDTHLSYKLHRHRYRRDRGVVLEILDPFALSDNTSFWRLYADHENPAYSSVLLRPPVFSPGSEDSLITACSWLKECDRSHKKCREWRQSFVPLRLLDLGEESAPAQVKLTTPDQKADMPYAALSYCWGGDQPLKTTYATIIQAEKGFSLERLPQTIRDAVHVTRKIGLRFLWIDSFCIVQDDEEELAEQTAHMHQIFRSAYVTIAATAARSCTDGFLIHERRLQSSIDWNLCQITAHCKNGTIGAVVVGENEASKNGSEPPQHFSEPLSQRGWTLQETMLSSRILSYSSTQLRWYCPTRAAADGGYADTSGPLYGLDPGMSYFRPRSLKRWFCGRRDSLRYPFDWLDLVDQFRYRKLSYPSDVLPAISAIAQRYGSLQRCGAYLAGVWERNFFLQLLWMEVHTFHSLPQYPYRAPSWSWASSNPDAAICWPLLQDVHARNYSEVRVSSQLLHFEMTLQSPQAPYGKVTAGYVRVWGKLKSAIWSADRETIKDTHSGGSVTCDLMKAYLDSSAREVANGEDLPITCLEICPYRHSYSFSASKLSLVTRWFAAALILVYDPRKDVYKRIGYLGVSSQKRETEQMRNPEWWLRGFEEREITFI